jgi:hypothetical protein
VKSAVLDIGTYPTIEAISLERYDTGFELIVSTVKIERDTAREALTVPKRRTFFSVLTPFVHALIVEI